jgi:predicted acylesterase/phospholipase RssA
MASQSMMTMSFRCMPMPMLLMAAMLAWNLPSMARAFTSTSTSIVRTSAILSSHERHLLMMSVIPHPQDVSSVSRPSRRRRILNKLGFVSSKEEEESSAAALQQQTPTTPKIQTTSNQQTTSSSKKKQKITITTAEDLHDYFQDKDHQFRHRHDNSNNNNKKTSTSRDIDYDSLLNALVVKGDTQLIGSPDHLEYCHPVVQLLHDRRRRQQQSENSTTPDGFKIALAIEGGGMRGCVSAGMASAIHHLNLTDTIDVVYGSSAGSIVGSYLITRQLPWFGPEVYYDQLTTAGKQFIDPKRLLRSMGLGLLDPRLVKDVLTRRGNDGGKPVLNLSFLLTQTLQQTKRLDWNTFVARQAIQPLKVVASALTQEQAIIMDYDNGSFQTLEELASCMHASCLLPGIAGPLMNLNRTAVAVNATNQKILVGNNLLNNNNNKDHLEPLADSLLYEPLPFRAAVQEGATHVIIIRSRPDGVDVSGKSSLWERLIFQRFLLRKNWLPKIYQYLRSHGHKQRYAQDVLTLNQHANSTRDYHDMSAGPHLLPLALAPGSLEITKLETSRNEIFEGLRRGFARAYDALVEDPLLRGRGAQVAKEAFPDEIMDYNPLDYTSTTTRNHHDHPHASSTESAFARYMKANDVVPNAWMGDDSRG